MVRVQNSLGVGGMQGQTSSGGLSSLIGVLIVAAILFFRFRNLATPRKQALGPGWLFISPLIALTLTVLNFAPRPPQGIEWLWVAAALALGAALGWWRGKTMNITIHPVTLAATAQASPAALLFLGLLLIVRYGLRSIMVNEAGAWHLRVALIIGCALIFGFGMLTAQRVEMSMRAFQLVQARQGAGLPTSETPELAETMVAAPPMAANLKLLMLGAAVFTVILIIGLALPR